MRWEQGRRSDNIEDRRGLGGPAVMGGDPTIVLQQLGGGNEAPAPTGPNRPRPTNPDQERLADFVSVVLADTEDTWEPVFQRHGRRYNRPRLVLFEGAVASACGTAQSAMGPFYCPNDQKVYIDLDFYRQLRRQIGAPGDFAQAYVIAHEVGHHVQQQLGIQQQVQRAQRQLPQRQANQLLVLSLIHI